MTALRRGAIVLVTLLAVGLALVGLAPTERSPGGRIRWVYVYVALVGAGTLALALAGTGGLGVLATATFALLLWDVGGARLVMHPSDPVRTASSAAIQATFALSFAIAAAFTGWTVWLLGRSHDRS